MIKRLFLISLRNLRRNFLYTAIVIGGLSVGITTFLVILQWTSWHARYDHHFPKSKQIYRISISEQQENFERHLARIIHGDIVKQLYNDLELPDIKSVARLSPFRNAIIRRNTLVFYEENCYECDPEFLNLFEPEMVTGDPSNVLDAPYKVILSESIARKYFGDDNPVGQTIEIFHQFNEMAESYEVTGVFKDFRSDSHFHIDLLTSFKEPGSFDGTAWVYLLLSESADLDKLMSEIKAFLEENNEEEYVRGIQPFIMPLHDIHMKSHLPRELEKNVQLQSIVIIFIAGVMVFLLAWFNFTLLSISQNQLNLKKLIYEWQLGSGRRLFTLQFFIDFMTVGLISFLLAILLSFTLAAPVRNTFGISLGQNPELLLFSFGLIVLILIISAFITAYFATFRLYNTLKKKYFSGNTRTYNSVSSRNFFIKAVIVFEFILTFVLLANLIMIRSQVNYAISQQIGSNDATTFQIPNLPRPVIDKYPVFRDELMKYPVFTQVTGMMEEPGGMSMDAFNFSVEGLVSSEDAKLFVFPVDENFLRFYDIELIAGDDFPLTYNREDTTEFFILNEAAAKILGDVNTDELLGRKLTIDFPYEGFIYPGDIIGVVKDFHLSDMNQEINPTVLFPEYTWLYCFSIRFEGNAREAVKILGSIWKDIFPDYPLRYYFTSEIYRDLYQAELTEIKVLLIFSILSLLIAGTGLFALSGFFMQQKMHAAAMRKINGANIRQIIAPELLLYLGLTLISSLIAIVISWLTVNKWLDNFSYQVDIQIWIFPAITLFLIIFSWISVMYHSVRLARLNPTEFIKTE
ncbi:ABC transporter permease [Bacteroidota bacterium]